MADRFCTSCGDPIAASRRFCTVCGAPAAETIEGRGPGEPPPRAVPGRTHVEFPTVPPFQPPALVARKGKGGLVVGLVFAALAVAGGVTAALALAGDGDPAASPGPVTVTVSQTVESVTTVVETELVVRPQPPAATPPPVPAASTRVVRKTQTLGPSVEGRKIVAMELGDPAAPKTILVIGCVHGDECAGLAAVRRLRTWGPPPGVHVWLIPNLNPDGYARRTRQNANGIDLNRNSPYDWRPLGTLGDRQYSGTAPLSEPEARIATSFVDRVRPDIVFWYHQRSQASFPPLIDDSGGRADISSKYALLVGLPFERKPRYPGSLVSWSNWKYPGTTAFVIELPGVRALTPAEVQTHASAVYAVARRP